MSFESSIIIPTLDDAATLATTVERLNRVIASTGAAAADAVAVRLRSALKIDSDLIGVNNRNLKTLAVDLATTEQLAPLVPKDRVLVAESGLSSPADLLRMAKVGASAFLIGESFMRKPDVEAAVRAMLERKAA